MKFLVPLEEEIDIITQLREQLSGVAFPQHVIDLQHATGKVLVPTSHWNTDLTQVRDFDRNWIALEERVMRSLEP